MKLKAQLASEGVLLLEKRLIPAMERLTGSGGASAAAMMQEVLDGTTQTQHQGASFEFDGEGGGRAIGGGAGGSGRTSMSTSVNWQVLFHKDCLHFELRDGGGGVMLSVPSRLVFERATIEGVPVPPNRGGGAGVGLRFNVAMFARALKTLNASDAEEIVLKLGVRPLKLTSSTGAQQQQQQRQGDADNAQAADGGAQAFLSFHSRSLSDMLVVQNVPVVRVDDQVLPMLAKAEEGAEKDALYLRLKSNKVLGRLVALLEKFKGIAGAGGSAGTEALVDVGIHEDASKTAKGNSGELSLSVSSPSVALSATFSDLDARWNRQHEGPHDAPGGAGDVAGTSAGATPQKENNSDSVNDIGNGRPSVKGAATVRELDGKESGSTVCVSLRALLRVLMCKSSEPKVLLLGIPRHGNYLHVMFVFDTENAETFNMSVRIPTVIDDDF